MSVHLTLWWWRVTSPIDTELGLSWIGWRRSDSISCHSINWIRKLKLIQILVPSLDQTHIYYNNKLNVRPKRALIRLSRREVLHQHTPATGISLDVEPLVLPPSNPTTPERPKATVLQPRTSPTKSVSRTTPGAQAPSSTKPGRANAKRKRKTKKPSHVHFGDDEDISTKIAKPAVVEKKRTGKIAVAGVAADDADKSVTRGDKKGKKEKNKRKKAKRRTPSEGHGMSKPKRSKRDNKSK
eukprot:m.93280 g.93280  ORF g.93280 m.93280 type:complete len:240 (+) comp14983_c0_seq1:534-1253(+)